MQIEDKLLSISQMTRPGYLIKNHEKIVIHYVGNTNTTAIANRNYFERLKDQNTTYASSHYIVGLKGEIIRCIPENEVAWHSGNLDMNYKSIGIENCHIDDAGKFNENTLESLYTLVVYLLDKYNLDPINDVIRHYDVNEKKCPKYYVDNPNEWELFKLRLKERLDILRGNNSNNEDKLYNSYIVTPKIGLNIREKPTIFSKKIGAYKYNTVILVSKIENGWAKLKDIGYVSADYIKEYSINNNIKEYVVTPKIGLNIRENPGVFSKKIGAYKYNTKIQIIEISNGWGRTNLGWVSLDYVKEV